MSPSLPCEHSCRPRWDPRRVFRVLMAAKHPDLIPPAHQMEKIIFVVFTDAEVTCYAKTLPQYFPPPE